MQSTVRPCSLAILAHASIVLRPVAAQSGATLAYVGDARGTLANPLSWLRSSLTGPMSPFVQVACAIGMDVWQSTGGDHRE